MAPRPLRSSELFGCKRRRKYRLSPTHRGMASLMPMWASSNLCMTERARFVDWNALRPPALLRVQRPENTHVSYIITVQ